MAVYEVGPHPSDFCAAEEKTLVTCEIQELRPDADLVALSPETTVSLGDQDLEIVDDRAPQAGAPRLQLAVAPSRPPVRVQGEKVFFRLRAGESLPPNVIPLDDELPRFAIGRKAVVKSAEGQVEQRPAQSVPPVRLPSFGLDVAPAATRSAVILPRFPIIDTPSAALPRRPVLPPVRLTRPSPHASLHSNMTHCTCHHCQQQYLFMVAASRLAYR